MPKKVLKCDKKGWKNSINAWITEQLTTIMTFKVPVTIFVFSGG